MPSNRINLVNEYDTGGIFLALFEHVADTACANTNKHLDKIRARDGEKGNIRLASDSLGEKGFTGSRGSDKQHALRNFATKPLEFTGILQELDNLLQLGFCLINAGDILKCDPALMFGQQFRSRFAKAHGAARATLHLSHEENPYADEQQHRKP